MFVKVPPSLRIEFTLGGGRNAPAHGIKDMTAHVAKRAGAKIESLAPIAGMVVIAADEGPLGRHAKPTVPTEAIGHFVGAVGPRAAVTPILAAPAMHVLHFADRTIVNDLHDSAVNFVRMNLNAHLRDEFLFGRDLGQLPGLEDRLRERFLREVQPFLHGAS